MPKQILRLMLTRRPGCGKTTVIMRLAELLQDKNIRGFYTLEIRTAGQRSGFSVKTFGDAEGLLSSIHIGHGPRVGRYKNSGSGRAGGLLLIKGRLKFSVAKKFKRLNVPMAACYQDRRSRA